LGGRRTLLALATARLLYPSMVSSPTLAMAASSAGRYESAAEYEMCSSCWPG